MKRIAESVLARTLYGADVDRQPPRPGVVLSLRRIPAGAPSGPGILDGFASQFIRWALLALLAGPAGVLAAGDLYPDYYAALRAQERGDCASTVRHLEAFLGAHPYVKDRYPDFYAELRYVMGRCTGAVTVRGVEEGSLAVDPLPEETPMEE